MKTSQWLDFFKKYGNIKIFHFNHLKLLLNSDNTNLRVSLSRLTKRKVLKRICRAFYANPFNLPTLEEISCEIYKPSYISLETALSSTGVLSQIPQVLTCVTTQLPQKFNTSFGTIEYRQIKKSLFWGFVKKKRIFFCPTGKSISGLSLF